MPLSSLPNKYGIGSFGNEAKKFIDLIKNAGIKIWQLLPLNPVGYGNSPYQSSCGEAIDEIYIDIDDLANRGYIEKPIAFNAKKDYVDYGAVRDFKNPYLKKAFLNQKDTETKEFKSFVKNNKWVKPYSEFICLLLKNNYQEWYLWNEKEKNAFYNGFSFAKYKNEILYYQWIQYILFLQFNELKAYALSNDIVLMGDIPFYVGGNSSDTWSNQDNFILDKDGKPTCVAGVPPDYFSKTGQRWGNPIYDWEFLKNDGFKFWFDRIKEASKLYSCLRIDHFRAFDTYYEIPCSCPTAEVGVWKNAYGDDFFNLLDKKENNVEIVAEDLGDLCPSVGVLRDKYNLKGMNVLEFSIMDPAFKIRKDQIIYTGTHDNDTLVGWYSTLTYEEKEQIKIILRMNHITTNKIAEKFIELAFSNIADYAIIPIRDYLGLDKDARMNIPGTLGSPNWEFKLKDFDLFIEKLDYISGIIKKYNR